MSCSRDILFNVCMKLDILTLASHCKSNKDLDTDFWRSRLKQDFHLTEFDGDPKDIYLTIYNHIEKIVNRIYNEYPPYVKKYIDKNTLMNDYINDVAKEVIQPFYDKKLVHLNSIYSGNGNHGDIDDTNLIDILYDVQLLPWWI